MFQGSKAGVASHGPKGINSILGYGVASPDIAVVKEGGDMWRMKKSDQDWSAPP